MLPLSIIYPNIMILIPRNKDLLHLVAQNIPNSKTVV